MQPVRINGFLVEMNKIAAPNWESCVMSRHALSHNPEYLYVRFHILVIYLFLFPGMFLYTLSSLYHSLFLFLVFLWVLHIVKEQFAPKWNIFSLHLNQLYKTD